MGGSGELRDVLKTFMRKEFKSIKEDDLFLGRVVAVYSDPAEDFYGTVDVDPVDGDSPTMYNVRVNAVMEGASRGSFTFPKLNSEVVVVKFQKDLDAVILLYSHIEKVEHVFDRELIARVQKVNTANPERYDVVEETDEFTQIRQTTTDIELKGAVVKAGSNMAAAFEPMVLGNVLAGLVTSLLDILSAATVTTSIGPQPFLPDTLAKLTELKGKVDTIKSQICQLQ